jgi:hypothetical protein
MGREMLAPVAATVSTERVSATVGPDVLPAAMLSMLDTARQELARHRAEGGLCAICGCAFPRERAMQAAFALEAV